MRPLSIQICATTRNSSPRFPTHEKGLRSALEWIRARHDDGALSPGNFAVLKMLEAELFWLQHREGPP
jgi:hypothetical protein